LIVATYGPLGVLDKIVAELPPSRRSARKGGQRQPIVVSPVKSAADSDASDDSETERESRHSSNGSDDDVDTVTFLRGEVERLEGEVQELKKTPRRANPSSICKRKACVDLRSASNSRKKAKTAKCTDCISKAQLKKFEAAVTFQIAHKDLPAEAAELRASVEAYELAADSIECERSSQQLLTSQVATLQASLQAHSVTIDSLERERSALQATLASAQATQVGSVTFEQAKAMMTMMQGASTLATTGLVEVAKLQAKGLGKSGE
jgi:hypothetical protein